MKKETLATSSAVGASLLIASCCIGPLIYLVFGVSISALGALSAFEPYKPYFIMAGGIALLYAGKRIFGPKAARDQELACEGDACAAESPLRKRTRHLFIGAVVFYFLAILYPYIIGPFF